METVDIKGKAYVMVNERLKYFRENYKDHSLITDIISMENGEITMKASIIDANNRVLATGHAAEKESNGFINKFSYVENCETSAWGRALANFGIGIDTSVASADEVANAIKNQTKQEDIKDYTDEINNANDIDELTSIWNKMNKSEQSKFKALLGSKKTKLKSEDPESLIKNMKKEGKTRPMIEEIIMGTKDKSKKENLINLYNAKLEALGIDEQYEKTPFED